MVVRLRLSRVHLTRNSPSYRIIAIPSSERTTASPLEVLGSYSPLPVRVLAPPTSPNGKSRGPEWGPPQSTGGSARAEGEGTVKVVEWNLQRVKWWLGQGAVPSKRVEKFLITAGVLDTQALPTPGVTGNVISRTRRLREAVKVMGLKDAGAAGAAGKGMGKGIGGTV